MYKNICFGKIRFPKGVINEDGKQFVKGVSLYVCVVIGCCLTTNTFVALEP